MAEGLEFWPAYQATKESGDYSILGYENGFVAICHAIDAKLVDEIGPWVAAHSHAEVLWMLDRAIALHAWEQESRRKRLRG